MARRNKTKPRSRRSGELREPLVNGFTAQHGDYGEATVVDLSNELGGGRQQTYKVLLNRGGSAIERWINEQDSKLFGRSQVEAIKHCQRLWARIDYGGSIVGRIGPAGSGDGMAAEEARNELGRYKDNLHPSWWNCFENVVRHDMPAGIAGEQMANNKRTSVEAAKLATAFVASMIAMWRGL